MRGVPDLIIYKEKLRQNQKISNYQFTIEAHHQTVAATLNEPQTVYTNNCIIYNQKYRYKWWLQKSGQKCNGQRAKQRRRENTAIDNLK